jgi:hypothetical protein
MFSAMIFEPASPNPKAKRAPILMIVYSNATVSKTGSFFFLFYFLPPDFLNCSSSNLSIASASFSSS